MLTARTDNTMVKRKRTKG